MLTPDEVVEVTRDLWKRHQSELPDHERVNAYVRGKLGIPNVPEGAGDELVDLARLSVKNVLSLVRDAFAQSLAVNGLRSPKDDGDAKAWALWQRFKMDARQAEIHRPCITFGTAYAVGLADEIRIRTPRQMFAVYADPHIDSWPVYALETWIDRSGKKPLRLGRLYDDEFEYPLTLGSAGLLNRSKDGETAARSAAIRPEMVDEPEQHGSDYCPVVRYVNARDAEEMVVGEVEPLIQQQKAINVVNFDRLVVSRFGAFPQKYAIGWSAKDATDLARVSAARLMSFDDEGVKVGDFAQASVEPYNSILEEMLATVAMTAQIPPSLLAPMANLSAEAIAMAEAPYQRKLAEKQESLGESHEQLIRHMAALNKVEVPDDAEVTWRETAPRSFAQVVDGIAKLVSAGVPIDTLLGDVPGWTKQQVDSAKAAIRRASGQGVLEAIRGQAQPVAAAGDDAVAAKAKADALGILIRAGVDPVDAAQRVGLTGIKFTGAVPVSLRLPESDATDLENG